jgi:hypothetical protein
VLKSTTSYLTVFAVYWTVVFIFYVLSLALNRVSLPAQPACFRIEDPSMLKAVVASNCTGAEADTTILWQLEGGLYKGFKSGNSEIGRVLKHAAMFILASKGFFDGVAWFSINNPRDLLDHWRAARVSDPREALVFVGPAAHFMSCMFVAFLFRIFVWEKSSDLAGTLRCLGLMSCTHALTGGGAVGMCGVYRRAAHAVAAPNPSSMTSTSSWPRR